MPQTAGEQSWDAPHTPPHRSRPGGVRLQLLGFLCHHTHPEVPPASSSTRADPQDLSQVGFVLLPRAFKIPYNRQPFFAFPLCPENAHWPGVGALDGGTFCWKMACVSPADSSRCPGRLQPESMDQRIPDSPKRQTLCSKASHPQHSASQVIQAQGCTSPEPQPLWVEASESPTRTPGEGWVLWLP